MERRPSCDTQRALAVQDPSDGLDEGIGASTKAFASTSGRSSTMARPFLPRLS